MTAQPDRPLLIRIASRQAMQPELLQGLETWLQLGLISEEQVRAIGREYLTCPLPVKEASAFGSEASASAESVPIRQGDDRDFLPPPRSRFRSRRSPATQSQTPNLVGRTLQAFMAEISVIWLLFLGVFLVVMSSGVLAASQWQNFPPVGQYGILFAYTLAFFGVGVWAERQPNLHLTARMLQITALLIIPVNFWMMDGFGLGRNATGILVATLACFSLTAITIFLLRPGSNLVRSVYNPRLTTLNSIGLSWLHWGWGFAGIPLIATYTGTVGTAFLFFYQAQRTHQQRLRELPTPSTPSSHLPFSPVPSSPATLILILSTLLLLGRAIFAAGVPLSRLGLALGICGWLLCWLLRRESRSTTGEPTPERLQSNWNWAGAALLLCGWAVSVGSDPPWQAIAVSGLAMWLLLDRLQRWRQPGALVALLLVGFQTYILLWRTIPDNWLQGLVSTATQWFGEAVMPDALLGLAGFPYVWLVLAGVIGLRRRFGSGQTAEPQQTEPRQGIRSPLLQSLSLANLAEWFALVLGGVLVLTSIGNPGARSVTLLFAALTLGGVVWKRPIVPPALIYLAHIVALCTITAWINWFFPSLDPVAWARILLGLMTLEWSLNLGLTDRYWRKSSWHLGLALATISYVVLLPSFFARGALASSDQNLIWLITPVLLTGLSRLRQFDYPRLAAWLSLVGLLAQLLLLNSLQSWIISLGVGTGLMLVNTATLSNLGAAAVTVGFALAFEATLVWQRWGETLTASQFIFILAANLWLLWLLWSGLQRRSTPLSTFYAAAANGWATLLAGSTLLFLTGWGFVAYGTQTLDWQLVTGQLVWGAGLVAAAIAYRQWQQPAELGFYGLTWAVEIAVALGIAQLGGDLEDLAIANLGLGLGSQLVGDIGSRRSGQAYRFSWNTIPLLYAGFGLFLAHSAFQASTGFYTLAAALVTIGVGRRSPVLKPFSWLGVGLISIGAYELLIYQLLQSETGNTADGIALMAGLAALIAWIDRLLTRWLCPYFRLTQAELGVFANFHWAIGSGLALLTILYKASDAGIALLIGVLLALIAYALMRGRQSFDENRQQVEDREEVALTPSAHLSVSIQENWTYAGIWQFLLTLGYTLYQVVPDPERLLTWAGSIAALVAVGLEAGTWRQWGWKHRPWRVSAAIFPALVVLITSWAIGIPSLLLVAAFYAWFAKQVGQVRLSYLSVFFLDWALLRYLGEVGWLNPMWQSAILSVSLLYGIQVDPALQSQSSREQRHWLRCFATGLVCLTALQQAEVEPQSTALLIGVLTLILSLGLVFAGLLLRIRAFLYVGTVVFIVRILRWLWLFINTYSLLLWAVGIVLGLLLIWLAATFEARRSQVNALLEYWSTELETWE